VIPNGPVVVVCKQEVGCLELGTMIMKVYWD